MWNGFRSVCLHAGRPEIIIDVDLGKRNRLDKIVLLHLPGAGREQNETQYTQKYHAGSICFHFIFSPFFNIKAVSENLIIFSV
jgi:hypothetical protein